VAYRQPVGERVTASKRASADHGFSQNPSARIFSTVKCRNTPFPQICVSRYARFERTGLECPDNAPTCAGAAPVSNFASEYVSYVCWRFLWELSIRFRGAVPLPLNRTQSPSVPHPYDVHGCATQISSFQLHVLTADIVLFLLLCARVGDQVFDRDSLSVILLESVSE